MTQDPDPIDEAARRAADSGDREFTHPAYAPGLRRLEELRPTPERDPAQAAAGRRAFLDQAAAMPVSQASLPRHRSETRDGRKEPRPMSALVGLLMALVMLFGGGGLTALAAQQAQPDDLLYPVKLAAEDVRYGLTTDPAHQVGLLEAMAERRFQEMEQLASAGEVIPLEAALRLEEHFGLALQAAAQIGDPELTRLLERLQTRLETQLQTMQQLRLADPSGAALRTAEQAMIQTQARIQAAIDDPAAFRQRMGAGRPADAPEQPDVVPGDPNSAPGDGGGAAPGPNPDAGQSNGQGVGQPNGGGQASGTCECAAQGDGAFICTAACLQMGTGSGPQGGYGPGTPDCECTPQTDGSLLCPGTCLPNLYLWATPGPHGFGPGTGRN